MTAPRPDAIGSSGYSVTIRIAKQLSQTQGSPALREHQIIAWPWHNIAHNTSTRAQKTLIFQRGDLPQP
eukprot:7550740-Pyramimonas_sp.AAC.1